MIENMSEDEAPQDFNVKTMNLTCRREKIIQHLLVQLCSEIMSI